MGRNAQGKTNLAEAVYFLSNLTSFRAPTSALVRHGEESAILRSVAEVAGREVTVDIEMKREGGTRLKVSGSASRSSPLQVVMFSPQDLDLIQGGPSARRDYLDDLTRNLDVTKAGLRQEFERVLRQRNGALKAASFGRTARGQVDVWTEALVNAGAALVEARLDALTAVGPLASLRYLQICNGPSPSFDYESDWYRSRDSVREDLSTALEKSFGRDLDRAITTSGPHRDDVAVSLGGSDSRLSASQGEQRSLALALRLAQRDWVASTVGRPLLILDDVFSELDDVRRSLLVEVVSEPGQSIITATSIAGIPVHPVKIIQIEDGKVIA